jgi:hypothetical protein
MSADWLETVLPGRKALLHCRSNQPMKVDLQADYTRLKQRAAELGISV